MYHLGIVFLGWVEGQNITRGAALGLKLMNKTGELMFRRGNEIPEIEGEISRQELFSICGKLLRHYPVAGWLRLACSYVKRRASGVDWEDRVDYKTLKLIQEILVDVEKKDPVTGAWHIPETKIGVVWCDASSIATGMVGEIGGLVKAIAERGGIPPEEAAFWYNMAPKVGLRDDTVPHRSVFNYEWRHPRDKSQEIDEQGPARIQIGEEVWRKPPNTRCTTQWGRGVITDVQSPNNLSVDGMPRHILDLRRVIHIGNDVNAGPEGNEDEPVAM